MASAEWLQRHPLARLQRRFSVHSADLPLDADQAGSSTKGMGAAAATFAAAFAVSTTALPFSTTAIPLFEHGCHPDLRRGDESALLL